ncbi:diguanylate cyclase domain-containing protein [Zoogloea sp.]|uniref:diguanylate cyclase domain-containing protein n=1 Tax=Zoogloea sp. TaxID=49181 RepID=UPI0035B1F571
MAVHRESALSPRLFWLTATLLASLELAFMNLAYQAQTSQLALGDQRCVTQQLQMMGWQLEQSPPQADIPEGMRQLAWITQSLKALEGGGTVESLDHSILRLHALDSQSTQDELNHAIPHWESYRHLMSLGGSPAPAEPELKAMNTILGRMDKQLAQEQEEAGKTMLKHIASALGVGFIGFAGMGALLLRQNQRSHRSRQMLRSVINQIGAGVCILGRTGRIVDANRAACQMLDRPRRELRGKKLDNFLQEDEGVWMGQRPDGEFLAVERIPGIINSEKGPLHIVTLLDVTARHLTAEGLQHLAHHDALTGLPNRGYLEAHFPKMLRKCLHDNQTLGVAVIDLDGFKPVNDRYGHAVGDALLVQVAQRLGTALRLSDVIVRTGGDEFVGIFPDVGSQDSLSFLGERLLGVFNRPFQVMGHTLQLGCSVGLSMAPGDGATPESLIHTADQAMYRVKQARKSQAQLHAIPGGRPWDGESLTG